MSDAKHKPQGAGAAACPECGAQIDAADARCWLCGRDLAIAAEIVDSQASGGRSPFGPRPGRQSSGNLQFSLESMFLVTTLVAVCLGALAAAPPLGVLAILVAAPALARTVVEGHYARQAGQRLTTSDKMMAFVASAGVTIAAMAAALGAFFTVCTGSVIGVAVVGEATQGRGLSNNAGAAIIWCCVALCLVATVAAYAGVLWILRPRRKEIS